MRAKAGGSQSSHDNQGKNAKSVGAMLRRYGEQALTEDVRALLREWSAHLQTCSAVFLSCPKTMRSVIFEEGLKDKDTPLRRTDPRVRLVPFMVGSASPTPPCNHHRYSDAILSYLLMSIPLVSYRYR